ncbi:hypothetical protein ACIW85_002114 [Staphylococcus aureus]
MNYETGFQLGVMDARLKKMRKQRDEYKKQRDELIGDIAEVKRKAKAFDEIDNLIYEVFEMMNCFKFSFINENKELILDSESNIFFSLKDCANKLDLVVNLFIGLADLVLKICLLKEHRFFYKQVSNFILANI